MKPEIVIFFIMTFAGIYIALLAIMNEIISLNGDAERQLYWFDPILCVLKFIMETLLNIYDFLSVMRR